MPSFKIIGLLVLEKKIFKGLNIVDDDDNDNNGRQSKGIL